MSRYALFISRLGCACLFMALPSAAYATDDDLEFWFNPTVAVALDEDTSVKLETAQRLRRESQGRPDTYFFRLWLRQQVEDDLEISGAIERRINDGRRDEIRSMQQAISHIGIVNVRLRLEQRFAEGAGGRMGLRLRSRVGVAIPLDEQGAWTLKPDIESFITFRNSNPGGDIGKTELRTQIAVAYQASDNLALKLGYLMQYDLEQREVDTVGHAPIVGIHFSF
ncbi:MAG: DUF2490 domain-containing protein [Pseudomonadota bacterium]